MTNASDYCFAADLGGTKLAAAMADARGRIVAELTEPTDPRAQPTRTIAIAASAAVSSGVIASRPSWTPGARTVR